MSWFWKFAFVLLALSAPAVRADWLGRDGALEDNGWECVRFEPQDAFSVKGGVLTMTCSPHPYKGTLYAREVEFPERGELSFEIKSGGCERQVVLFKLGDQLLSFRDDDFVCFSAKPEPRWKCAASHRVPQGHWVRVRVVWDNAAGRIRYYAGDSRVPTFAQDGRIGPDVGETSVRIKIGNYGLVGKTTTHELRNLSLRRTEESPDETARERRLALVFRGLGSEFPPLADWLKDFRADEIVDFYLDFRGSSYLPKNNMILDGYPEDDLIRQAKLIILADMPLSADVLPYCVQTNLLAAVSDGARLLATGGLLGLEKCGDRESPVARALPGLGSTPWHCPDGQKAVVPHGKGKICVVRSLGREERRFAKVELTEPKDGSVVPLLTDAQKAYLSLPRATRREKFADSTFRKSEMGLPAETIADEKKSRKAYWPKSVRLMWTAKDGVECRVVVKDAKTGVCVYEGVSEKGSVNIDNLEVAATYEWSVDDGESLATARFRTEDVAPRLVRFPGVPNVRDLGGRIGCGGKRVRQGMVFRSARLNEVVGKSCVGDENGAYVLSRFGIRSDIDLRSDKECLGMTGSPLGESVTWFHYPSSAYGGMQSPGGKAAFAHVFRVFLDRKNYPIDFHCISGQDRTGAVAFILNALLGVEEEQLYLDWEVTGFWNRHSAFRHEKYFDKLMDGFKKGYPAPTINESVEKYVLSIGFTAEDIDTFRRIMLD